jgi:cation diffusion facilitator CzcD-associated flavoprotein CzcO
MTPQVEHATVCIIGSGFAGIAAAAKLREAGITDIVVLERAQSVGGTWRDNTYPGCACDIPSHLYSLSFALNPDWTYTYARQPEIRAYLEDTTTALQLRPHLRFGADIEQCRFDASTGRWTIEATDGRRWVARFLIAGVGGLRDPLIPALPGLGSFAGPSWHSARWDDSVDLRGKRVAVVGTGASAIQVVPAIAETAAEVHVFQRTPPWIVPRQDRAYTGLERSLFRAIPALMRALRAGIFWRNDLRYSLAFARDGRAARAIERLMRWGIRRAVSDPDLAERLTPTYSPGCKRILISSDWYPALQRDDVQVHDGGAQAIHPGGVEAASGEVVPVDVLLWCTGFRVDDPLGSLAVVGPNGQDLRAFWGDRPRAHLGMTAPGFPNAFLLLGPNTALGHNSVVAMIEAQVGYAVQAIRHAMSQGETTWLDVRPERLDAFIAEVDRTLDGQVWQSGCRSWYLNEAGENFTIWPGSAAAYARRMRHFDAGDFTLGRPQPGGDAARAPTEAPSSTVS